MATFSLKDWQVIILRQEAQAQPLVDLIHSLNGQVEVLAPFDIVPVNDEELIEHWLMQIRQADYLIVVSSQAPLNSSSKLRAALAAIPTLKVISMGKSTTKTLEQYGFQVFLTPPPGTTSESLLNERFLQSEQIRNQKIILWSGLEGRTVLEETLKQRQANVVCLKTYQQVPRQDDFNIPVARWRKHDQTIFLAFSQRSLESLLLGLTEANRKWCVAQPLVVISQRLFDIAQKMGFNKILIAQSALPEDINLALHEMNQF